MTSLVDFIAGSFYDQYDPIAVTRVNHQNTSLGTSPWCQGLGVADGTNILIRNNGNSDNGGGCVGERYSSDLSTYLGTWGPSIGSGSPTTAAYDASGNVFVGDGNSYSIDGSHSLFKYSANGVTQLGAWNLTPTGSIYPYRLVVGQSDGTVWWVSYSADTTLYRFNPGTSTAGTPIVVSLPSGATSLLGIDMCSLPDGSFVVLWRIAAGANAGLACVGHYDSTGSQVSMFPWSSFNSLYGGDGPASTGRGNGSVGMAPDGTTLWIITDKSAGPGFVFRVDLSSATILSGLAMANYDGIYWSTWSPPYVAVLRATPRTSRLHKVGTGP